MTIPVPTPAIPPAPDHTNLLQRGSFVSNCHYAYLDTGWARRVRATLNYGMAAINRTKTTGGAVSFVGVKQSGLGREGNRRGAETFVDFKYIFEEAT